MGVIFYNIFLFFFRVGIHIASLFNAKAKKWVQGRKDILKKIKAAVPNDSNNIWVHCASLGEFEQGRPLIEKLKDKYPGYKILLTFFSPSGYEVRKNYTGADWVFYLPMDSAKNARIFLDIVNPKLVIFVKYEFWYYYLKKIKYRNVPLLLVSALFWKEMSFFKWYGAIQRKMLLRFDHLFVQNKVSQELMASIGLSAITSISGDTRFDRVIDIAENAQPIPAIENFIGNNKTIIAGSTWEDDEVVLQKTMVAINDQHLKLIIAPHEITEKHIASLLQLYPDAVLYSQLNSNTDKSSNILIIDNIGLLSRLYKYATITYIGGGFGRGIHNVLEAAVYGKTVVFGPTFHKFKEAADLIKNGGAITIQNAEECIVSLQNLLNNPDELVKRNKQAREYVYENKGATDKIIHYIQEKRLLTN